MAGSSITNGLNPLDSPLTLFIIQLLLIIVLCKILNFFLSYIKQPPVISEVITGIILGPSVLGQSENFTKHVFPATSMTVLSVIANIGLIFFMFMVGLEIDASVLRSNLKASMIISFTSIIVPFAMGIGLSAVLFKYMVADGVSFGLFAIFVGVAISITAFPVLARILTERKIMHSKVGVSALAAASVDDVIAWILLAVVVSYAKNTGSGSNLTALWTFLLLAGFIAFMFMPVRLGIQKIYDKYVKTETHRHHLSVVIIMMMFASAFFTEVIGVHAIFGAFILGISVPRSSGFHLTLTERIEDIVTIVLLPLYFTNSGLRTNLSSINSATAGGLLLFIIFIAIFGKVGGATLAAKFTGNSWRESVTIGFLMNTKGLVELIVLNIGLDIKVLDQTLFSMFVVMALVTTFMTTPIVHFVWTKWETAQNFVPMVPRENGKFNTLIYVSQTRIGAALTNIVGAITPSEPSKKYVTRGIFINQTHVNRPSTYFFNNVNNLPKQKKESYLAVQSEAKNIGIKIKPTIIASAEDASEDILCVAKYSSPDLVLLGFSNENSVDSRDLNDINIENENLKSLQKVLQNIKSCVGVLYDRGLDRFHIQHDILTVFTDQDFEKDSLTVLFKMARRTNIKVTCLTNKVAVYTNKITANPKLDINRFTIVETSDPYQEFQEKTHDQQSQLWLGLCGSSRDSTNSQEKLIQQSNVSILFVYPANTLLDKSNLNKSQSIGHFENADQLAIELQSNNNNNTNNNMVYPDEINY